MKFIIGFLTSILLALSVNAQESINLLKVKLNTTSDSQKINAYRDIFNYYLYSNGDSARYYATAGLKYAKDIDFKWGIGKMLGALALLDEMEGKMELSRKRFTEALAIFQKLNDTGCIAAVYSGMGIIEGRSGNYLKATRYFLTALKLYESIKSDVGIHSTYLKLGTLNDKCNNLDKALEYYYKALAISKKQGDNTIFIYNNIGAVFCKKGEYKKALNWFYAALKMFNEKDHDANAGLTLTNIGQVYDILGNEPKALFYLNKALALARNNKKFEDFCRVQLNIATITSRKDSGKAIKMLAEALGTAQQTGLKELQTEVLDAMILIKKEHGQYQEAISLLQQYHSLKDTIYNLKKQKEIANLQSVYDLEKSNNKVLQLRQQNQRQAMERNIVIVVAVLLMLAVCSLLYHFRKVKKLNEVLSRRENELERSNEIKDKLFSIIGHDLRGPLGNIPMALELLFDDSIDAEEQQELQAALKEQSLAALETLDKLLYWGQSQIKGIGTDMSVFETQKGIDRVLRLVNTAAVRKQIAIHNHIPENLKVYADPVHFEFILRNLVANAIKFTHKNGTIHLAAQKQSSGYVVFSVNDNGVGIEKNRQSSLFETFSSTRGTANEKGTSIGLMLCKEYVQENGGKIWLESEPGEGTTFYFSLKEAVNVEQDKSTDATMVAS